MKAKEYMQQAFFLDKRINSLVRQVSNLWDQATSVSQVISDMPHNPSKSTSKLEDRMVDIVDLTDEIKGQAERLKILRKEMMGVISVSRNTKEVISGLGSSWSRKYSGCPAAFSFPPSSV